MRGINLKKIAASMQNASGAETKAVCTEAGMFALRERRIHVTQVWNRHHMQPHIIESGNTYCLYIYGKKKKKLPRHEQELFLHSRI